MGINSFMHLFLLKSIGYAAHAMETLKGVKQKKIQKLYLLCNLNLYFRLSWIF